ncbi:SMC-Scp complex subunit ScpB [Flammeovirga kamogawensis]|uniref:SMC-Scp complex subunit ScpB n=2 Tax=Flammeovirga kamogawensis TaxID=373891 RepID=A0ABX8H0L1_9BACT|nr:SMC-Scp complex subunit ScpB [Flammeovirga kamogawensis]QWG09143.1 SMC-Scp complex subunit ScpB [Flammeovirga kamogawensis]TRX70180.1 SMC-Scp complex subunit ScpB [Flammeovirga kamogawensis]
MEDLQRQIEAMIFVAVEPISIDEIEATINELDEEVQIDKTQIEESLVYLTKKYNSKSHSFELVKNGEGYNFLTKKKYREVVNLMLKNRSKRRLSKSALETLSIIAYRQPITKGEIEKIRGVGSDYAMKKLLQRELVKMKGKSDAIGRPMLYGTTDKFLEYFGISSLKDLPSPKEFSEEDLGDGPDDDVLQNQEIKKAENS